MKKQLEKEMEYPFEIRPLMKDEGGGYLITFPDLPGCMSDGETVAEAIENGKDAMCCWLTVAREDGDPIPEPMKSHSGQYVQRLPKSLHTRLAALARAEGTSMNQLALTYITEGVALSSVTSKRSSRGKSIKVRVGKRITKKTTVKRKSAS